MTHRNHNNYYPPVEQQQHQSYNYQEQGRRRDQQPSCSSSAGYRYNKSHTRYHRGNNNNNKKVVDFTLDSSDDENDNDDENRTEEVSYQEASYTQTTLIPIYYSKDEKNAKLINGTSKLRDLCNKFDTEIVKRSKIVREKTTTGDVAIPNYRQLLQTKKFSNFTTCNCDQPSSSSGKKNHHHHHHHNHHHNHDKSESSSSSSSYSSSSSDSSSESGSSSGGSDNENEEGGKKKERKTKKKKSDDELSEFDDIRSMEINRKLNHPERLHSDLSFNEPEQTNEGPLCKCKLKNTTFGTRHQIYYGEKQIPLCDDYTNNANKLYHYRMTITPYTNFIHKVPTFIEYDKHEYLFEGFSIFSHEKLPEMPDCVVVIYNHEYKLNVASEEMIDNFTIKELELLKSYIFEEILELYDLKWKAYNVQDGCNCFHIMPRFCRTLPYNGKEILSPCEIIKYFLCNSVPVVSNSMLSRVQQMSENEWQRYVENIQGSLVTQPAKRPSSIRLDQLDRDHLLHSNDSKATKKHYPLIIHFNMFRNTWLPMMKNNLKLKKLYHKYFKLRHLLNNKSKLTTDDKAKLRLLGEQLETMIKKASEVSKEIMIELSSENFYCTGIRTDIVQQAVLIPTFVEHIRFHQSLKYLEDKTGYVFKNRLLLQYALTHPSGAFLLHQNLGSNPDHIRNTLYNCRARNPNYGDLTPQKRKSLLRKKGIHMLFSIMSQKAHDSEESSCISNYERLEFLGDKILELLTSKHLFFLFPMFDEGQLSEYRNALVQNQYLAVLAKKLDMHYFIIFYHGVDLCSNSALNHALANSFEALLAAVFLDSDLDTVSTMLCRILWDESDLKSVWSEIPLHPIQAQQPEGDRHLIATTKILEHVQKFEDMIGVEFNHIRLLAQAFCTRSASFNLITLGDNQRLEFLGDTVLNFVVSDYLYRYFPKHHEGHLSLLRSSLVCNSTQALLYDELGMSDFVLTSYINNRPENNGNLKRKADVFEAFVGALYIDQGLEAVVVFCNVCMFNKLQDIILYQFWNDPKSRLQQCCLSLRDVDESKPALPTYKLIEEKGPPNRKQYRVAVYFMRKRIGEGIGKSIHEAEVEAAKNALKTNADMFPILNKYVMSKTTNSLSVLQPKTESVCDKKPKNSHEENDKKDGTQSKSTKRKHEKEEELEEGECKDDQIIKSKSNCDKPSSSARRSYSSSRFSRPKYEEESTTSNYNRQQYYNNKSSSQQYNTGYPPPPPPPPQRDMNYTYHHQNYYYPPPYQQQRNYPPPPSHNQYYPPPPPPSAPPLGQYPPRPPVQQYNNPSFFNQYHNLPRSHSAATYFQNNNFNNNVKKK